MKRISGKYSLLGYDFGDKENFEETYALAEQLVEIVLEHKKSYAEACKAFEIAKNGLKTMPLNR